MPPSRLYYLLQSAAHGARRHADEACLATAGVTATQGGVLYLIRETPGLSQRQVARALDQRDSAVVTMVSRLLSAGLITRKPQSDDPRVFSLSLTEKGAATLRALEEEMAELHKKFEELLEPGELEQVSRALEKLATIRTGAH